MNFIWAGKRHCIPRQTLYVHQSQGGLTVPNILNYYKTAQLKTCYRLGRIPHKHCIYSSIILMDQNTNPASALPYYKKLYIH
ncbi:hypothetical protein XELAEV_18026864mg [Xenopus laevis]|uniref:Uncharacterized protein n=1 Tax=Xenopus laevis TaxID=8355 RepID=A0A974HJE2_XENLA|nr:hypothetical protein XELAEV_18026864mg [Xenopus laevis]